MNRERPQAIVGATAIIAVSTVVLFLAVGWGVLNGGLWVGGPEGLVYEAPAAIVVGYGPLVPIGAILVFALVSGRSSMLCLIGFGVWFAVVALDIVILGSPMTTPAFLGAIPMALTYAGRNWFTQDEATK